MHADVHAQQHQPGKGLTAMLCSALPQLTASAPPKRGAAVARFLSNLTDRRDTLRTAINSAGEALERTRAPLQPGSGAMSIKHDAAALAALSSHPLPCHMQS